MKCDVTTCKRQARRVTQSPIGKLRLCEGHWTEVRELLGGWVGDGRRPSPVTTPSPSG